MLALHHALYLLRALNPQKVLLGQEIVTHHSECLREPLIVRFFGPMLLQDRHPDVVLQSDLGNNFKEFLASDLQPMPSDHLLQNRAYLLGPSQIAHYVMGNVRHYVSLGVLLLCLIFIMIGRMLFLNQ